MKYLDMENFPGKSVIPSLHFPYVNSLFKNIFWHKILAVHFMTKSGLNIGKEIFHFPQNKVKFS